MKTQQEQRQAFMEALRTGCPRSTAARRAGLTIHLVNQWLMEAQAGCAGPEIEHFAAELLEVESQIELLCHATVIKAAQDNPKWASWYIGHKRRHYEPRPPEIMPPEVCALPSKQQQRFVVAYVCGESRGNAAAAYRAAGYTSKRGAPQNASRLMRTPPIQKAVKALTEEVRKHIDSSDIMYRAERLRICTAIARDPEYPPRARLAAIRLHAELQGGFNSKVEHHDIVIDLVPPRADGASFIDTGADGSKAA